MIGKSCLALALCAAGALAQAPAWKMTWHDEFDGARLDTSKWVYVTWRQRFRQQGTGVLHRPSGEPLPRERHAGRSRPLKRLPRRRGRRARFHLGANPNAGQVRAGLRQVRSAHQNTLWAGHVAGVLDDGRRTPRDGRTAARSTSWRISGASPPPCMARFTAPAIPGRTASARPSPCRPDERFRDDFHLYAVEWEPGASAGTSIASSIIRSLRPVCLPARSGFTTSLLPPVESGGGRRVAR